MKAVKLKYLKNQLKGNYFYFVCSVIFICIGAFFEFLTPKLIGVTVDSIIGDKPFDLPNKVVSFLDKLGGRDFLVKNIFWIIGVFAFVAVLCALCEKMRLYCAHHLSENLGYSMRKSVFNQLQKATFEYHTNIQTGDIIQRCSSDIDLVRSFVVEFTQIVRIAAKIAAAYWFMTNISLTLSAVSFIGVPTVSLFSVFFYKKIQEKFTAADNAEGDLQALAQESLSSPRVVRAFGKQKYELDRFSDQNSLFTKLWIKVGDLLALFWAGGDILTVFQVIPVLCVGTVLTVNGSITTGDVVSFITYNGMLNWPIRSLGRIVGNMSKATVALERVSEIATAPTEDYQKGVPFSFEKSIVFDNVCFSFEGMPIFKNLSFEIKKGQTVAILGASGSGKSTILALLCGFYKADSGRILIDGVNVNDINIDSLRKNISLVMQEPFLFSKTVRENIAITGEKEDFDKVVNCAKIAQVHESIMSFADGYDTVIGEQGVTVSGGQKQRIAIARSLYTGAQVILFDDSLSAVDTITDRQIRENLKQHTQNTTCVIISQRVNTLMQADNILVLSGGKIVQQGSHEYLCSVDGIYKEIVKIQQEVVQKANEEAQ